MKKSLSLFLFTLCSVVLVSWGIIGHKTVATIAQNHLTPKSKEFVKTLLGDTSMADVASWADQVLKYPTYKSTAPNHYLNVPLGLTYKEFNNTVLNQTGPNVYKAVYQNLEILITPTGTRQEKSTALKFLIHFVGDLHQPMHISREEDKGGNTIQLQYEGKGTNLHSLWDGKLIGTEGKSFEQMSVDYDKATPQQIKQWQSEPVMKWLFESYEISSKLYLEIEQNNKLDDAYFKSHISIVNQRILMAGIRLAGLINRASESKRERITTTINLPQPKLVTLEYAAKHIGETVQIKAAVVDSRLFANMLLLNMGAPYPNQILTIVLKGEALTTYKTWACTELGVIGKVVLFKGKPQIVVGESSNLSCKVTVY